MCRIPEGSIKLFEGTIHGTLQNSEYVYLHIIYALQNIMSKRFQYSLNKLRINSRSLLESQLSRSKSLIIKLNQKFLNLYNKHSDQPFSISQTDSALSLKTYLYKAQVRIYFNSLIYRNI